MIEVSSLTKMFGSFAAVDNISLSVQRGEIFSFLGVNGAGKTTTLRMIAGTLKPTAGRIQIGGFDMAQQPREAKSITGYIPDRPHVYDGLTGREFLLFVSELYSIDPDLAEERIASLLKRFTLAGWEDELIESYSHGMKQRIVTCAALVHQPQVLIVDEPMVGLDPHGAKLLKESLKDFARNGMTIFLSTHSLNVAEELSHRLAIIDKGRIISIGTMAELRSAVGMHESDLEEVFLRLTAQGDED